MSGLRIALFTGNYNHISDGVSLTLNRLVGFLEESGAEVLVFAPTIERPPVRHNGRMIAVPSVSVPGRSEYRFSVAFPKRARAEIEDFNPDIVHIATPDLLGYKALKWAEMRGKTVVTSYHTHFTSYLKYYRFQLLEPLLWGYLRWFYKSSTHIYVPTPSMAENLRENGLRGDMRIWARGVDTNLFSPSGRDENWRSDHGFKKSDIVVLFVSRLVWEKNLKIYAETLKAVAGRHRQVKALVVGDGPARQELQELLPEAVYTGFLTGSELAKAYACSDIFLFPSDTESFGNVTLEAMASGLPCVVADAVGSKSLVDHEENGYLVPVSRPESFSASVTELVTKPGLRVKMGEASRRKAEKYTWDKINKRLLSDYRDALNVNFKYHKKD